MGARYMTLSANGVSVTVWENTSRAGKQFMSFTVSKSFKNDKDEWQNSGSFMGRDLPILASLLLDAFSQFETKERTPKPRAPEHNEEDSPF